MVCFFMFLLPYNIQELKDLTISRIFCCSKKINCVYFFYFAVGANRLDQGSDEDNVFNDDASVISNVSCGSSMKDEGIN